MPEFPSGLLWLVSFIDVAVFSWQNFDPKINNARIIANFPSSFKRFQIVTICKGKWISKC
jgi:hypothetical protein